MGSGAPHAMELTTDTRVFRVHTKTDEDVDTTTQSMSGQYSRNQHPLLEEPQPRGVNIIFSFPQNHALQMYISGIIIDFEHVRQNR